MKRTDGSISQRATTLINKNGQGNVFVTPLIGVVLNVYYADDDKNIGKIGIECDIVTYAQPYKSRMLLRNVPVLQHGGYNNVSLWVPNPTTKDISGKSVKLFAKSTKDAYTISRLEDLDGDHVLITFINGNVKQPIITGCLPHPNAKVKSKNSNGNRRYLKQSGVAIEIDKDGNISIDIKEKTSSTIQVKNDSDVLFEIKNGIGTLTSGVLYEQLKDILNDLINSHTHTIRAMVDGVQLGASQAPVIVSILPNKVETSTPENITHNDPTTIKSTVLELK